MSMPERRTLASALAAAAALAAGCASLDLPGTPAAPRLGLPVSVAEVARWDRDVFPDGRGLPPGAGRAAEGAALFRRHCQACHGAGGRGASAEELAGATEPLSSATPDKTIGSYWPYATTLFDFIRRAKPMGAPGSLTADEVYALSAYLLQVNGVIDADAEMNARTLPAVRMPNRDGFVGIDAAAPR